MRAGRPAFSGKPLGTSWLLTAVFLIVLSGCDRLPNRVEMSPDQAAEESESFAVPEDGSVEDLNEVPALDEDSLASLDDEARSRIQDALLRARQTVVEESNREALLDAYGHLSKTLMAFNFDETALSALENAHLLDAKDPQWIYYQGYLHLRAERFDRALELFETVQLLSPASPVLLVRMAEAHLGLENISEARDHVEVAILMDKEMARAHAMMGEILAEQGSTENAAKFYERALELQPSATRLNYVLGQLYEQLGRDELAESFIAKRGEASTAIRDPFLISVESYKVGTTAVAQRAKLLMEQERWTEAKAAYQSMLSEDPDSAEAHLGLGASLIQRNNLSLAKEHLDRAIELDATMGSAYFNLAMIDLKMGHMDKAQANLDTALSINPDNPDAILQMAQILRRSGQCAEAIHHYQRAVEHEPTAHAVRLQAALCMREAREDQQALDLIEEGARLFPDQLIFQDALSRLLSSVDADELRDPARAREIAEALLEAQRTPEFMDVLAMAQAAAGDYETAAATAEEAMTLARASGMPARMIVHLSKNQKLFAAGERAADTWPVWLLTDQ